VETNWRRSVQHWKVEQFFDEWIVRADDDFVFCYRSQWKWLAMREARRLVCEYGGELVVCNT
jgi:hypothetical protein